MRHLLGIVVIEFKIMTHTSLLTAILILLPDVSQIN